MDSPPLSWTPLITAVVSAWIISAVCVIIRRRTQETRTTSVVHTTPAADHQSCVSQTAAGGSSLDKARRLHAPVAIQTYNGQFEAFDFWEDHASLFASAWREYGRGDESVYRFGEHVLDPRVKLAMSITDPAHRARALRDVVETPLPGVYTLPLLNPAFCTALLEELDRLAASGIPMRRPNGMNRHGAILSHLGFEGLLRGLRSFVAPLACEVHGTWCGMDDLVEEYGFTVRYAPGEDTQLDEHFDTSNLTLNICLGKAFRGGDLYFKGIRQTASAKSTEVLGQVAHTPGRCVLHLGGHRHGARPIEAGERTNLILWCSGVHGTVRITPRNGWPWLEL